MDHESPNPLFDEPIYSVAESAKMTGLKPMTLWDKLAKGELIRTKVGDRTFIRLSELRKLITESRNEQGDQMQSQPRRRKAKRTLAVAR